ncbi:MAG: pilus assembly protein TadG-related protein [Caulobacterales bacterium]
MSMKNAFAKIGRYLKATKLFVVDNRGNVAIIAAAVMLPLAFSVGMGIDYTMATRRQDQLNGFADAAALAAVTPTQMTLSSDSAQTAAQNMFLGQVATVTNVSYVPANVSVVATDTVVGATVNRTVTVNYTAASQNVFSSLLGVSTLPITGTSTATSSVAPNIDFYLILDTSPSMEIAATTAGINTMVANTAPQGGCAFGCHETNPGADGLGNPSNVTCQPSGTVSFPAGGEDNFALARCLNVPLRIDLVNQATQNLMTVAQTAEVNNNTTYRAAIYTMDRSFTTLQALTSNLATAQTAAANLASLTMYSNNHLVSGDSNSDEDTYLDLGLNDLNGAMPNPGNGTKNLGDTPQEVMFIVSDGVNDEAVSGNRRYYPISTNPTDWCTTIKARGIRIAFLYTTYNPLPTNGWYNTYIAPEQNQIAPAALACASPGLYYEVSTDGDISAALTALFQKAVATARLLH